MAKQVLNNGDTGLQFRTKANENFTELYDTKAPLANPALTGVPTVPTATPGTNTTQAASTAFVRAAIAAILDSTPGALDTLNELAAALGDDPNFATTITNALAGKVGIDSAATLDSLSIGSSSLGAGSAQFWDTVTAAFISVLASDESLEISGGIDADGPVVANSLSVGGLATFVGALRLVYSAMPALAIDVTKSVNTKTINGDTTLTFSNNTPSAGTRTETRISNGATAGTLTIPSCFSSNRDGLITTIAVKAGQSLSLAFEYSGSRWEIYGDPVPTSGTGGKYVLLDDSTPPTDGQVMKWVAASSKWIPANDTGAASNTEQTATPSGTTASLNLNTSNFSTLNLGSASGTVALTLTVPTSGSARGDIIVTQGATPRHFTVAVNSGTVAWHGGSSNWNTDLPASKSMSVAYRWDGSVLRLFPSVVSD